MLEHSGYISGLLECRQGEFYVGHRAMRLSPERHRILMALWSAGGEPVVYRDLHGLDNNTLKVQVCRIRGELKQLGCTSHALETIDRRAYRLVRNKEQGK